jgi:high mobility group AT-hook protein 2
LSLGLWGHHHHNFPSRHAGQSGIRPRHIPSVPPMICCGDHSGCPLAGAHDAGTVTETLGAIPSPLLFKCRERSWLRAHFPSFLRLSSKLYPAMSSPSCSAAEGEGSGKKTEAPEMAPPASRKRGRPKGSRNKKSLAALAAAATTAIALAAATGVALAPSGEGVQSRWGPGRSRKGGRKDAPTVAAASSPPRHRGRPLGSKNKKTLAALGAAASGSARPHVATSSPGGPS